MLSVKYRPEPRVKNAPPSPANADPRMAFVARVRLTLMPTVSAALGCSPHARRRRPQRDQLVDWRTIWGNVTLGLEVRHENTPEHRGGVHDLLEQYQLAGFARKLPNQLSGGMRQRCALIRTLATSPDVLLLDEPFSALDYQTRLAVSGDISQIIRREHKTALLVTHDISEAISLSDRIVVLSHRPATVKAIHDLGALRTVPPLERRSRPEFQTLFNQIWEELDVNV